MNHDPYYVSCEDVHLGISHEQWLSMTVSERIAAATDPDDECVTCNHHRFDHSLDGDRPCYGPHAGAAPCGCRRYVAESR